MSYEFLKEKNNNLTFEQIVKHLIDELEPKTSRFTKNFILLPLKDELFEK